MIIALCGNKGAGKNTVAISIARLYEHLAPVRTVAFADPIKAMVCHIFDLDPTNEAQYDAFKRSYVNYTLKGYLSHNVSGRHVVREIGMLMRKYDEGQFVRYVESKIASDPTALWVITDLRFDNEMQWLRSLKSQDALVVRVQNNNTEVDDHISEAGFPDDQIDVTIFNDTLIEHLDERVSSALDHFITKGNT